MSSSTIQRIKTPGVVYSIVTYARTKTSGSHVVVGVLVCTVYGPVHRSSGSSVLGPTPLRQARRGALQPRRSDEGRNGLRDVRRALVRPEVEQVRTTATLPVVEHRSRRCSDETLSPTEKH